MVKGALQLEAQEEEEEEQKKFDSPFTRNFTWAGQTFGGVYESDSRLKGDLHVKTVTCNGGNRIIAIPAPSSALVFLSEQVLSESDMGTTVNFPTTVFTKILRVNTTTS
ncbi:hypothetical protein C8J56DRAFT_886976 [Mycena floridula]|nr:hypothetical protein C8J56DRAFT_886976 [Mycena floridula]